MAVISATAITQPTGMGLWTRRMGSFAGKEVNQSLGHAHLLLLGVGGSSAMFFLSLLIFT